MRCHSLLFAGLTGIALSSQAAIWVNETNQASEADYCNLQFPSSFTVQANTATPLMFGRLYEAGLTPSPGAPANTLVDVGFGIAGTDPRFDPNWVWIPASYNLQIGNDDEYMASFVAPPFNGIYSYTFRFSIDNGATYTAADLDGAGSNAGLDFNPVQLGVMTVIDGVDIPEPVGSVAAMLGFVLLRRRVRR